MMILQRVMGWIEWPYQAWQRWYWRETYRARRQLEQDVRRFGGRVYWDE